MNADRQQVLAAPTQPQDAASCRKCGMGIAPQQRYCLECGEPTGQAVDAGGRPGGRDVRADLIVPPQTQLGAPAGPPQLPPTTQTYSDDERRRRDNRYAIYGAAGASALLLAAFAAGALGAGIAKDDQQPAAIVQPAATAAAAPTVATAAVATFSSDWPAGESGWTVIVQEFDKSSAQPTEIAAFKTEVSGKGLDAGALDSDEFASLDSGKYVVYVGRHQSEKDAKAALKDVQGKGYPDARVAEIKAASAEDTGADSSDTVGDDQLEQLDNLSPEESAKQRLKLPDETSTEGEAPPTDDKESGGGSEEVTIGSLGDHFGVGGGSSSDTVGVDVNSLNQLRCIWPGQTGVWTVGRAMRLAPGLPTAWAFPTPVNDFFSGSQKTPGATFCAVPEFGMSAALAFKGRFTTAAAARKALKGDTAMKSLNAHVIRVVPIEPDSPIQ